MNQVPAQVRREPHSDSVRQVSGQEPRETNANRFRNPRCDDDVSATDKRE